MKKLDRFLLRDILSDGPAGTVYRAEEILPGDNRRVVALKVLPGVPGGIVTGESEMERHFFGEVRVLAQLAVHPHVVTIYAMGVTDGYPWLAMEYSGQTLQQRIGETPADPAEVLRLMEQVGKGLLAMHSLKPPLIHQDIKPANILIDQGGSYKITDFSLATVTAAHKTHALATVRYAAPELLSSEFGPVGPATDLYALGHIAYEMALGSKLHRAQFPAVFEGNPGKEPPPNKWMMWHASMGMKPAPAHEVVAFPGALGEVIARLMAKPAAERYRTASDLLSDLAVLRHAGSGAAAPTAPGHGLPPHAPAPASASAPLPAQSAAAPAGKTPAGSATAGAASAIPGGTGAHYWVRLRGKITGPFDLAALQRQLKQGQISRFHQVSADQVAWKPATEVVGLYGPTTV